MGFWSDWFLISEGKIYYGFQSDLYDRRALQWLSQQLTGISKENSFEAAQGSIIEWQPQDDLTNPYGDRRGISVESVWTLDLDIDLLTLNKHDGNRRLSVATLRERPITLEDLEPYKPAPLPKVDLQDAFPLPYWNPPEHELQRVETFVTRILTDFAHQWRHILRNRYNESTFHRLASAIIHIVTLNFNVVEEAPRRRFRNSPMVGVHALPKWAPIDNAPIIQMDTVRVILTQDIEDSIPLVRRDYTSCKKKTNFPQESYRDLDQHATYLVLSLRHVVICEMDKDKLSYAQPEPLFDGVSPPSKEAIRLLLIALQSAPRQTSLHYLPAEVQDLILKSVSEGGLESARMGCFLDLGTPFLWKSGDRALERVEYWRNRFSGPIDQQIWFTESFSGLAYC